MIVRGNRRLAAWRGPCMNASLSSVSLPDQWRTCTTESILELEALGDFVVSKSGSGLPVDWGVVFPPILIGVPAVCRETTLNITLKRIWGGGGETYQRHWLEKLKD
jgi:hypothetical protein